MGPNGEMEVVQGPGAASGDLTKTTANEVQKKILSSGDTLSQIAAIRAKAKPEYQQIGPRWGALVTSMKDKSGLAVSPEDKQQLNEFTAYRAEASQMFSNILKDLSGTAVTPGELARAEGWLPNPGTGLVDGDSPTELASKVDRMEAFTKRALAKYSYINQHGLDPRKVDVDQMPKIIQDRGDEIAGEYAKRGLEGDQLKSQVKARLVEEFGLGAM